MEWKGPICLAHIPGILFFVMTTRLVYRACLNTSRGAQYLIHQAATTETLEEALRDCTYSVAFTRWLPGARLAGPRCITVIRCIMRPDALAGWEVSDAELCVSIVITRCPCLQINQTQFLTSSSSSNTQTSPPLLAMPAVATSGQRVGKPAAKRRDRGGGLRSFLGASVRD